MHSEPASTEVMVDGGVWRRPGPSLSARDGFEGIGRTSGEMASPGSMSVCVAMGRSVSLIRVKYIRYLTYPSCPRSLAPRPMHYR